MSQEKYRTDGHHGGKPRARAPMWHCGHHNSPYSIAEANTQFWRPSRIRPSLRRLLHWRRQRRRIGVAARATGPDRSRSESQMVLVHVVFAARILLKLFVRFPGNPCARVLERLGVELRVLNESFDM